MHSIRVQQYFHNTGITNAYIPSFRAEDVGYESLKENVNTLTWESSLSFAYSKPPLFRK